MSKKLIAIGLQIPGGEIESEMLFSRRSLLDADIILFRPSIPKGNENDTYLGKICLSDDGSFKAKEALAHWRRELGTAIEAGKLVVVFLNSPQIVYAATGEVQRDGTGRNARRTRIVEELDSYSAIPVQWKIHEARGSEMSYIASVRFFAGYWNEFSTHSRYEAFIEGKFKEPILKTKSGDRVLGVCVRKGKGTLLAIPVLNLDDKSFFKQRMKDGIERTEWTDAARIFGKKLISAVIGLSNAVAAENIQSPPPEWVASDKYTIDDERKIRHAVVEVIEKISTLEDEKSALEAQYEKSSSLRKLLYEQGKQLENCVLDALTLFGFKASSLKEGDSEFDAVFESEEGRFIGEVEGKDNKAINIDKFSQLERNLNEDFAREGVAEYAKGALFGNAFRLIPPESRGNAFTDKCLTAAKRLRVALVRTEDLFIPCNYIKSSGDKAYAKSCREALFSADGEVVKFPTPPGLISDPLPRNAEKTLVNDSGEKRE